MSNLRRYAGRTTLFRALLAVTWALGALTFGASFSRDTSADKALTETSARCHSVPPAMR